MDIKWSTSAWVCAACLPALLFVTQCTPVVGCWGEPTYAQGQHLGFTIGMDRLRAVGIVASSYDVADVSVWSGGNDIAFVNGLDELMMIAAPFQQWRFDDKGRPYCATRRNVVLVFRAHRLVSIKDETDITLA